MAGLRVHLVSTGILCSVQYALSQKQSWSDEAIVLGAMMTTGILLDADHLSIRRIKKLIIGDKEPIKGWVDYCHTVWATLVIAMISILFRQYLGYFPLIAYVLHMAIDGGNKSNLLYSKAPLPILLHLYYPEWAKYENEKMW